jgi:hypothetical protein
MPMGINVPIVDLSTFCAIVGPMLVIVGQNLVRVWTNSGRMKAWELLGKNKSTMTDRHGQRARVRICRGSRADDPLLFSCEMINVPDRRRSISLPDGSALPSELHSRNDARK